MVASLVIGGALVLVPAVLCVVLGFQVGALVLAGRGAGRTSLGSAGR
jgi:hypothetical protein